MQVDVLVALTFTAIKPRHSIVGGGAFFRYGLYFCRWVGYGVRKP